LFLIGKADCRGRGSLTALTEAVWRVRIDIYAQLKLRLKRGIFVDGVIPITHLLPLVESR